MRRSSAVSFAIVAAVTTIATVTANADVVRDQLAKRYAEISNAYATGKIPVVLGSMTADYTVSQPGGKIVTREMVEKAFKSQLKMMSNINWTRTITKIEMDKNAAHATVTGAFTAKFKGKDGKLHDFAGRTVSVDTWVKDGGAWKRRHSVIVKNHVTMDGHTMQAPGAQRRIASPPAQSPSAGQ